jgi:hypothetical protein
VLVGELLRIQEFLEKEMFVKLQIEEFWVEEKEKKPCLLIIFWCINELNLL